MTTREKYAEAAAHLEDCGTDDDGVDELFMLAAHVLRQLASGAVLCKLEYTPYKNWHDGTGVVSCRYVPIAEQP